MSENSIPKPSKSENDEHVSINFGKKDVGSLRAPVGLKDQIDNFLRELLIETGVQVSRNAFILNACRFYLRYLLQAISTQDLVKRLKEEFKLLDEKENGSKIEE